MPSAWSESFWDVAVVWLLHLTWDILFWEQYCTVMKSSYLQAVYLPHTVVRVCMCIPCLQGKYPSYSTTVRMHSQIRQLWLIQTVLLCIRLNKSHGYKTSSLKVTHNKYLPIVPVIIQNLAIYKKKNWFFSSSTISNVCNIDTDNKPQGLN